MIKTWRYWLLVLLIRRLFSLSVSQIDVIFEYAFENMHSLIQLIAIFQKLSDLKYYLSMCNVSYMKDMPGEYSVIGLFGI